MSENSLLDSLNWGEDEPERSKAKVVSTRLDGEMIARMEKLAAKNGLTEHALRVILFDAAVELAERGVIEIISKEITETKVAHSTKFHLPGE